MSEPQPSDARLRWTFVVPYFVTGGIAAFASPYLAPGEMPPLERLVIIFTLFGGAYLLASGVDRLLRRRR